MGQRQAKILIVDPDREVARMLADHFLHVLPVEVATRETAAEAIRQDMATRSDLILCEWSLPDGDGLYLARQLQAYGRRPIILMTDQPTVGRAVEALRLGVKDLLIKPFDVARLASTVQSVLEQYQHEKREHVRTRRMRQRCRQLERDRRELHDRVELICRDLVTAYGHLARRVVALQTSAP